MSAIPPGATETSKKGTTEGAKRSPGSGIGFTTHRATKDGKDCECRKKKKKVLNPIHRASKKGGGGGENDRGEEAKGPLIMQSIDRRRRSIILIGGNELRCKHQQNLMGEGEKLLPGDAVEKPKKRQTGNKGYDPHCPVYMQSWGGGGKPRQTCGMTPIKKSKGGGRKGRQSSNKDHE